MSALEAFHQEAESREAVGRAIRSRLLEIMTRHFRPEDLDLSDREFVLAGIRRWEKHLSEPLIDVGE